MNLCFLLSLIFLQLLLSLLLQLAPVTISAFPSLLLPTLNFLSNGLLKTRKSKQISRLFFATPRLLLVLFSLCWQSISEISYLGMKSLKEASRKVACSKCQKTQAYRSLGDNTFSLSHWTAPQHPPTEVQYWWVLTVQSANSMQLSLFMHVCFLKYQFSGRFFWVCDLAWRNCTLLKQRMSRGKKKIFCIGNLSWSLLNFNLTYNILLPPDLEKEGGKKSFASVWGYQCVVITNFTRLRDADYCYTRMFEGLLETEVVFSNISKCPDCFRSMH